MHALMNFAQLNFNKKAELIELSMLTLQAFSESHPFIRQIYYLGIHYLGTHQNYA